MSSSNEYNLTQAASHIRKALARIRTVELDEKNLLTDFQSKMMEAYQTHLEDIRGSIQEIREDVTERRENMSTTVIKSPEEIKPH